MNGPHDVGFNGFYRIVPIMDGGSGTGQVIDFIHFKKNRQNKIMTDQFEIGFSEQMSNIAFASGEKIIQAQDLMPLADKTVTKMGA